MVLQTRMAHQKEIVTAPVTRMVHRKVTTMVLETQMVQYSAITKVPVTRTVHRKETTMALETRKERHSETTKVLQIPMERQTVTVKALGMLMACH